MGEGGYKTVKNYKSFLMFELVRLIGITRVSLCLRRVGMQGFLISTVR